MRILGIDPGSTATGFGIVERREGRLVHVAHGTLRPSKSAPLASRLARLHADVSDVVRAHAPDVVAVEEVFVSASARSALVLGQARGAVLAALAGCGVPVAEYNARSIKQAVSGSGSADKKQVQRMVGRLLELDRLPGSDAADALAAAICHANSGRLAALGSRPRGRSRGGRRRGSAALVVRRVR